ncbi:MAG: MraY family glycosyltransferase [Bacteroidota bacterium]
MPFVIRLARKRGLVDHPKDRSSHTQATPSLGGIPIFFATIITTMIFAPGKEFLHLAYVFLALVLVFLIGTLDDIRTLSAKVKLPGQLLVAAILVVGADVRLDSMYGLLGFTGLFPYWLSVLVSMFTVLVIMNSFNLIDGINGLAAGLGCLINICLGCWFYLNELEVLGLLALSLAGALLAFLRFNITPARIFMGDTGSLLIGTLTAMLTIRFIDLCSGGYPMAGSFCFDNPVAIAVALLIVPLFDTIRVFITRMLRGKSPLKADRRHIHHLLIDSGLSHMTATSVLMLVTMSFISLAFRLDAVWGLHVLLALQIGLALLLTYVLHRKVYSKKGEDRNIGQRLSQKTN